MPATPRSTLLRSCVVCSCISSSSSTVLSPATEVTTREKRASDVSDVGGGDRAERRRAEATRDPERPSVMSDFASSPTTHESCDASCGHVAELRAEVGDARRRRARFWVRRVGRRRGSGDRDEGRAARRRAENRVAISRFWSTRCAETNPRALLDDGAVALRRCRVRERAALRRRGGRGRNEGRDRQRRELVVVHACDLRDLRVHAAPAEVAT